MQQAPPIPHRLPHAKRKLVHRHCLVKLRFSLDIRTPEVKELRWSHQISGTCFDTLPDLQEVTIILSYWHCLKETCHSQAGTILVPSSGNITKIQRERLLSSTVPGPGCTRFFRSRRHRCAVCLVCSTPRARWIWYSTGSCDTL